ncbi:ATP-dependent protease ATPase subunit HslU [Gammaproteobacteria bacterium]|nr:ATP-dependent protease ATPase subunit HslU [Gammaproteobacteria bacterium]
MSSYLTPSQIVKQLDQYVVGQEAAKKAVATALRSRWRRLQIIDDLRDEISPKNILMVGPTGVGKTEIARRLADQSDSPFIKVEATKFTEVGYVGRDVDSIIRDLVETSMQMSREAAEQKILNTAEKAAIAKVIDVLKKTSKEEKTRPEWSKQIKSGELDEHLIEIDINLPDFGVEIMAPAGMEEMSQQLQSMFNKIKNEKSEIKKLSITQAIRLLTEEEASKLINEEEIRITAIENAEQKGIVFIDEIDKVVKSSQSGSYDVSREGVQRDLLPLLEGSTVSSKYGPIETDHILFIASGAFMNTNPKDMISELQGRLPIRVSLESLNANDFARILTEPTNSLTKQYCALLQTEGITIKFTKGGIQEIAQMAYHMNNHSDNIGARRLHTVLEKLLEDVSFDIEKYQGETIAIDQKYVKSHFPNALKEDKPEKWIL